MVVLYCFRNDPSLLRLQWFWLLFPVARLSRAAGRFKGVGFAAMVGVGFEGVDFAAMVGVGFEGVGFATMVGVDGLAGTGLRTGRLLGEEGFRGAGRMGFRGTGRMGVPFVEVFVVGAPGFAGDGRTTVGGAGGAIPPDTGFVAGAAIDGLGGVWITNVGGMPGSNVGLGNTGGATGFTGGETGAGGATGGATGGGTGGGATGGATGGGTGGGTGRTGAAVGGGGGGGGGGGATHGERY
jgi:hypothetical protein